MLSKLVRRFSTQQKPVSIKYSQLIDDKVNLFPFIKKAYGAEGLGLLVIEDVPEFEEKRRKVLFSQKNIIGKKIRRHIFLSFQSRFDFLKPEPEIFLLKQHFKRLKTRKEMTRTTRTAKPMTSRSSCWYQGRS